MNILIVEDEPIIARRLMRITRSYFNDDLTILQHCSSLEEGNSYLHINKIDLLLLDLNLNGENGFDLLIDIVSQSFPTIIISAYRDRALKAFEYGVLDFVPKPFSENRLFQAFSRFSQNKKIDNTVKFLSIYKSNKYLIIDIKDVLYIKGARVYTEIYLKNGRKEIHNKSLDNLEKILPHQFVRIHKSYIVDMSRVSEMNAASGGKYTLLLKNGDLIPVSRNRYKDIRSTWFK